MFTDYHGEGAGQGRVVVDLEAQMTELPAKAAAALRTGPD